MRPLAKPVQGEKRKEEQMSCALSTANLSKRIGNVLVLDDLQLEVPQGSVFGLIGENGAGKTPTIKILVNILRPTTGRAEVLGVDSCDLGAEHLAKIGYVSENQGMPDWMTVGAFLEYLKPFYPTWDAAHAQRLIRQFELPPDRKLRDLSRGMRMQAALASSLAYRPRLIVLDEPFTGLDPLVREDLIAGLGECAGETTIFISSHDLAEVESFVSHVGYLNKGRLKFSETMSSLIARFREIELTLGLSAMLPADDEWPASWLQRQGTPARVRFVETRFDQEQTTTEIRRRFGTVEHLSINPMPLRAIFIALAREGK